MYLIWTMRIRNADAGSYRIGRNYKSYVYIRLIQIVIYSYVVFLWTGGLLSASTRLSFTASASACSSSSSL